MQSTRGSKSTKAKSSEANWTRKYLFKEMSFPVLVRRKIEHRARFERELKAEPRGPLGSMTRFHWVCEEGGKWRAPTNGPLLLSRLDSSIAR